MYVVSDFNLGFARICQGGPIQIETTAKESRFF